MTDIASLKKSIDDLNNSINYLVGIFKGAAEEIKTEPQELEVDKKISPLMKKISILEEQNEKIARGIVAVADMLKERERRPVSAQPRPIIKPSTPPPQQSAMPTQTMPQNPKPEFKAPAVKPLPRIDEKKEERKSFFDMFKK